MRKWGTNFFECYARETLNEFLGPRFGTLVNMDRPDLQSADGVSLGIEVTRAMEQNKESARQLLKELAGVSDVAERSEDIASIVDNGYAYGLQNGKYIGTREYDYWAMALPLQRILESKVSKAGNGFYGHFDKLGLYVFCKDAITDSEVIKTCRHVIRLQQFQDIRYDRLYLSDVGNLHVCNLEDGLSPESRIASYDIPQDMRKSFYLSALRANLSLPAGENDDAADGR